MKKLAFIAVFALAACSQAEETAPVVEETAAAPEVVALTAADGGTVAGTYEVTSADGSVGTQVVNADGTFTLTNADGVKTTGTVVLKEPNLWCETETGATEESCYTEEMSAEGVWTSTSVTNPEEVGTIVRKM